MFAVAVVLVVALLVLLSVLGSSPDTIGYVVPDLAIFLFALWELGHRKRPQVA